MAEGERNRKSRAGASLPLIPDKLYFRIGEAARLLALPAHVLRFWESEFPHLRPYKGGTGQRLYRRRDVEALLEIRRLLYDRGYTIPGARQLLAERTSPTQTGTKADPSPDAGTADEAFADALLRVYTGLRELSLMLGRPPQAGAVAKHHGFYLTSRRRSAAYDDTPSLFAQPLKDPEGPE